MTLSSERRGRAEPVPPAAGDPAAPPRRAPAQRCCTRNGCQRPAVATLTYVYAASTAVVGPLAGAAEPHTYDLCADHARTLTAPRGWELVRHDGELTPPPVPDDLAALAEALWDDRQSDAARHGRRPPRPRGRTGHLRVVPPS